MKKRKKHDKIVLLAKIELNTIEVLISRTLIDSDISQDEVVTMNNVFIKYNNIKEEIKKPVRLYRYDWYNKRKKVYIKTKNISWIFIVLTAQGLQTTMILTWNVK